MDTTTSKILNSCHSLIVLIDYYFVLLVSLYDLYDNVFTILPQERERVL